MSLFSSKGIRTVLLSIPILILLIAISSGQTTEPTPATGADQSAVQAETAVPEFDLGEVLPLWTAIPFAGILLSIALFPLLAPHFWHHHFPKVSAGWALLFAVPFIYVYGGHAWHEIFHIFLLDYIPFIYIDKRNGEQ